MWKSTFNTSYLDLNKCILELSVVTTFNFSVALANSGFEPLPNGKFLEYVHHPQSLKITGSRDSSLDVVID
jgi:hypothetical protein